MKNNLLVLVTLAWGLFEGPLSAAETRAPRRFGLPQAAHRHSDEFRGPNHTCELTLGGRLDSFNTADYLPTYGGNFRQFSRFEPTRYVVLENIGDTDAINPRLVINGRRDWHSAETILAEILPADLTNAETALAIWAFLSRHDVQGHNNNTRVGQPIPSTGGGTAGMRYGEPGNSHPSRADFRERCDPVKAVNCYYDGGCSQLAANFVVLCRRAGIPARAIWLSPLDEYENHCVAEAYYDGGWHLFDADMRVFHLERDNSTVASYETLHRDPALISRTHYFGLAGTDSPSDREHYDKCYARYFPPKDMPVGDWAEPIRLLLRPGESFIWLFEPLGKWRYGDNTRKRYDLPPAQLANGKLIYRPRLVETELQQNCDGLGNIETVVRDDVRALQPRRLVGEGADPGERIVVPASYVLYHVRSPWPIVGGVVGGRFVRQSQSDLCRISISVRDSDWQPVWTAAETGEFEGLVAIDDVLQPLTSRPIYDYWVMYEIKAATAPADTQIREVYLESDVQLSATALPAFSVGRNACVYTDDNRGRSRVRVAFGWEESTATAPPAAPARAVCPLDSASIALSEISHLYWTPAVDPEGRPIAKYHVQVSPRRDMLYPLSPNFDRLTGGEPQFDVPPGFCVPGREYFWRVRAQDADGAWSGWSDIWSFASVATTEAAGD